jgi:phenylacetate-CoA ligase
MREFRISEFLSVRELLYWRRKLWKSQYDPPEKLAALQWSLLSRLLDHCFRNVPYYRREYAGLGFKRTDIRTLKDYSRLPVIDKEILLGRGDEFKADDFGRHRPKEIRTSGTTGTPLSVYWDIHSNVLEIVSQWRHFSWSGYRLGTAFLDIRNRPSNLPEGYRWNRNCRGLELSAEGIDRSNIERFAAIVRKFRPKLWRGHPSAMADFARLLQENAIEDLRPRIVVSTAETLLENDRAFLEKWAGVPVCDNYGQNEHVALICQCPRGGLHIAAEYGLVEILGNDGRPAGPGEEGRIIATGLHNRAFPLLRYDTSDLAIPSIQPCACGRTLPLVSSLTGRIDDRIKRADGKWISGLAMTFKLLRGLRKAQLVQNHPKELDVHLVPGEDYGPEVEQEIRIKLEARLGPGMEIRIHCAESIPFPATGKYKFIVNRLPEASDRPGRD